MPSYTEGTRQWAEQQRDQAYRLCIELLQKHGFKDRHLNLEGVTFAVFQEKSPCDSYEMEEDWRIYRQLVNEFFVMCDYVECPPVADDGQIFYSVAELEAAGQRNLFAMEATA